MLTKFMVIVWLGYNYEQPVLVGQVHDCDKGQELAQELQPNHKAFACFTKEHWDKNKFFILRW
jgi:glutamyl/glutaminyl-tRNA synthetase|tara:strand:- start:195 stop:383 length:189 start_codon:yes stop_codon:yes gene_type:complete